MKYFKDFDFKLHQFVRPIAGLEQFLDWVREREAEPLHVAKQHDKEIGDVAARGDEDQPDRVRVQGSAK